jgi:RNA polymerase sigma-70 factor (ECF subfamily)
MATTIANVFFMVVPRLLSLSFVFVRADLQAASCTPARVIFSTLERSGALDNRHHVACQSFSISWPGRSRIAFIGVLVTRCNPSEAVASPGRMLLQLLRPSAQKIASPTSPKASLPAPPVLDRSVPARRDCGMGGVRFQAAGISGSGARFEDTNWWVVREAADTASTASDAARAHLCSTYWRPIYSYLRRAGYGHEDAQDLTQEFFARLFEKNFVQLAAREKGRFRSWLLLLLKRFVADQRDRAHRQKRGGGQPHLSLDPLAPDRTAPVEPSDLLTPDKIFDRAWAESVLEHAMAALRAEWQRADKIHVFEVLEPFITCRNRGHYADAAAQLGMTANHVKVTVHRMRRRLRDLLRAELARTARTEEEIEDELRDLLAIFQDAGS